MDRMTNKIKPCKIFMGEKDFQQLYLVKKYFKNRYKSKIISCKTIRDKDKLALSSRNLLLNQYQLKTARKLSQDLLLFKKKLYKKRVSKKILNLKKKKLITMYNIDIEYFELRNLFTLKISNTTKNSKIFIAYYINKIRLIDNF